MQTADVRGMLLGWFQLVNKKHILSIPNEQTCLELVYSNHFFHRCLTQVKIWAVEKQVKVCLTERDGLQPGDSVSPVGQHLATAKQKPESADGDRFIHQGQTWDQLWLLAGGYSEHTWMQRGQTDTETFSLLRLTSKFKSPTNTAQKQDGVGSGLDWCVM